jgi:hypothetical protein
LSSPMRPSPQRERSALSSFASNKTMRVLRLDLCYEPACLRSVFLVVEILKTRMLTPPPGPQCKIKPTNMLASTTCALL